MRRDASTRLLRRSLAARAPLALCAALLLSCGPGGDVPLRLTWRFADGRRCPEAGAARVVVTVEDRAEQSYICIDGEAAGYEILVPARGARILLRASSPSGAPLYRGRTDIDPPIPTAITVDLHFTGGS